MYSRTTGKGTGANAIGDRVMNTNCCTHGTGPTEGMGIRHLVVLMGIFVVSHFVLWVFVIGTNWASQDRVITRDRPRTAEIYAVGRENFATALFMHPPIRVFLGEVEGYFVCSRDMTQNATPKTWKYA